MQQVPKIVFLADEIPQTIHAGSIQFYRLFKNYPKDRILVIGKAPAKGAELLGCNYQTLTFPVLERLRLS